MSATLYAIKPTVYHSFQSFWLNGSNQQLMEIDAVCSASKHASKHTELQTLWIPRRMIEMAAYFIYFPPTKLEHSKRVLIYDICTKWTFIRINLFHRNVQCSKNSIRYHFINHSLSRCVRYSMMFSFFPSPDLIVHPMNILGECHRYEIMEWAWYLCSH